jgi:DNA (cytosine-5)-methyltransferase 1
MIPVVDIFAGPGGLGEGFCALRDKRGRRCFKLGISIEKDVHAYQTLKLRAFCRAFDGTPPPIYHHYLRREITWEELRGFFPREVAIAESEAHCIELGQASVGQVRTLINDVVPNGNKPWALIGGPPCQAYSLIGRARNRGVDGYRPELDHRQKLYVEYLQILADHAPPVFVMENVKGLLSAQLESQQLFQRILDDLVDPAKALRRENRRSNGSRPTYEIRPLLPPVDLFADRPADYVVQAELYGIPQRRHRVILIGIRSDISRRVPPLVPKPIVTVKAAFSGLPRVRSGLSGVTDSDHAWIACLKSMRQRSWLRDVDPSVRHQILGAIDRATRPAAGRGSDYLQKRTDELVLNHSTRSHIVSDLERYLFASAFAAEKKYSPVLGEFPDALLPKHQNVNRALGNGLFTDRFRVQLPGGPATTVTSHISKDGHYYIHHDPTQCRSLTVREAARLQTFPDDYFFCGPRTAQYQQVGNAVPPQLAMQIANSVADLLRY